MKKAISILFFSFILQGFSCYAQAPYESGAGIIAGFMNGLSYKTFAIGNKVALQTDLGVKFEAHDSSQFWTVDINPNIMFQHRISISNLYWFLGVGTSVGYAFTDNLKSGKFGVNVIGGIEYKFNIPLSIQLDYRPGYGLLFSKHSSESYFDWGLNLSFRYTF
ncbi:MAG: autotransporter outer membrane beta-barrel domain-containing protein [Bacteroidales bacterium]|jgi:outer membrane autotransporter protein|nr:autotransporter outer membrane beta-barrel domain-containing protein [Bacteroidales bacterium]